MRALLGRPVAAVLAGDGPERAALEATARRLARSADGVRVELSGWVDADRLESLCAEAHVLAVPSLWPEPLGQIGIEAGSTGLPSAAFDVGGISDWLHDGETGHLAELSAGAGGLASAIASCVRTPEHYGHLGRASAASARRYAVDRHLDALLPVLEAATVASATSGTASPTRR